MKPGVNVTPGVLSSVLRSRAISRSPRVTELDRPADEKPLARLHLLDRRLFY